MRGSDQFRDIAARHMPRKWRLAFWRSAPAKLNVKGYRDADCWGLTDFSSRTIWINPDCLGAEAPPEHTLLHEIGHVLYPCLDVSDYIGEYVAEKYATQVCRAEGIVVPRETVRSGKLYVKRTAFTDGFTMQDIRWDIRRWIGDA